MKIKLSLPIALKTLWLIVVTWLWVHGMAIIGIFVALLYPIHYLFSPHTTPCLVCQRRRYGDYCLACRRNTTRSKSNTPRDPLAVFLNSVLVLSFTMLSVLIIQLEHAGVQWLSKQFAQKPVSFVIPDHGQHAVGELFTVDLQIKDITTSINAVQADLRFNPEEVELIDFKTNESFATIFIQKEIDNIRGFGRLTGGLPNPGYSGNTGLFAHAVFKAKKIGLIQIEFLPTSMVLANDRRATNILRISGVFSYLIVPTDQKQQVSGIDETELEDVLGAETTEPEGTKLILYDERRVLGTESNDAQTIQQEEPKNILWYISKVDGFIVGAWKRVFGALL